MGLDRLWNPAIVFISGLKTLAFSATVIVAVQHVKHGEDYISLSESVLRKAREIPQLLLHPCSGAEHGILTPR